MNDYIDITICIPYLIRFSLNGSQAIILFVFHGPKILFQFMCSVVSMQIYVYNQYESVIGTRLHLIKDLDIRVPFTLFTSSLIIRIINYYE